MGDNPYSPDDSDNFYYSDDDDPDHPSDDELSEMIDQSESTKPKYLTEWQLGIYDALFNHFPYEKYNIRDDQREIIERIIKALYEGKKLVLIQAPTGVGKSAISYAVMKFSEDGYVCSSTKALQEQMLGDFLDLVKAEGRSNFICLMRPPNKKTGEPYNCDEGACKVLKLKCDRKPSFKVTPWIAYYSYRNKKTKFWQVDPKTTKVCPYWECKAAALMNFAVVHNYAYILAEANHVKEFTKREALVSDEAHNIEGKILDFIKVMITQEHLDYFNMFLDPPHKVHFISVDKGMANYDKIETSCFMGHGSKPEDSNCYRKN